MTTPMERIQRLRQETVRATTPSPRWDVRFDHPVDDQGDPVLHHCDNDEVWVSDGQGTTVACVGERYTNAPVDAVHMARWDPQAAARALDLLALLFDKHFESLNYDGDQRPMGICDREPVGWPCATYTAALALLDTIDPEGA